MIGNKNTHKLHQDGCKAIEMMKEKNMVNGEEELYEPCKWCGGLEYQTEDERIKPCLDKYYVEKADRCIYCDSKNGVTMMYPHEGGYNIKGEKYKQWVFFHCFDCGLDSPVSKILDKRIRLIKEKLEKEKCSPKEEKF